jgi:prepilin-type N-terminal cleavage/methylation domain-containing protein
MNPSPQPGKTSGLTLMEIVVTVAILLVLAGISYPIILRARARANKVQAIKIMENLGAALGRYAADHDGMLPDEDVPGKDNWAATALPGADNAWYNALPRAVQSNGAGDYVKGGNEAGMYTPACMLYLPGAHYPAGRKMAKPLFGIAYNSRLQRRGKDGSKPALKLNQAPHPSRTVVFFERGLPGEARAHPTISRGDYDGSPKGTAKAFVARYLNRGVITCLDGSAKDVGAKDLLEANGNMIWSEDANANSSMLLWAPDPRQDPNLKADQP